MLFSRRTALFARFAAGGLALFTLACSSNSGGGEGGNKFGTGGSAGMVQTGGSGGGTGQGGSKAEGGRSGSGGAFATGGSSGTGGTLGDAGVACTDDAGSALPAAARQCTVDSDCTIAVVQRCCGFDQAIGEAKSRSSTYATCLALPPSACQGLGCAKFLGYSTDTGKSTPVLGASDNPLDWVTVRCLNHICTTDVLVAQDAGRVTDGPVDSADVRIADAGSCGTSVCTATQLCIRPSCGGGTAPTCLPIGDAGECPSGYTFSSICQRGMPGTLGPGCLPPPCVNPPPFCLDTPAACSTKLTCGCLTGNVCGVGGGSCMMISGATVQCGAA